MKQVAIIGGGFAGLAAGAALAERGVAVTVLEERAHLGGRAYSFRDEATGEVVDNGQHALMGCYHHTLAFLERIGAGAKVVRQRNLRVEMIHPQRGRGAIACPSLPSPLHVGAGLLGYSILSRRERLGALLAGLRMMAMRRRGDARLRHATLHELLCDLGQSQHTRESFWNPVAIATLNEAPERAAAAPFAEVLARAFFGSRTDSQFVLPAVGLSELYTDDASRFIRERGGMVSLRARVIGIDLGERDAVRLRLADGRRLDPDACISTLPPRVLDRILSDDLRRRLGLPALDRFETAPIVSAHLWFDRPVLGCEFVGLLGTRTQWVFNRSGLLRERRRGADGPLHALSAVISAGRDVVDWDAERIAMQIVGDLRSLVPAARTAVLLRSVVVREKNATVSPTPAAERLRPPIETRAPAFFVAGDWVATGLPPTIESAVLSGARAADLVLRAGAANREGDRLAQPIPARAARARSMPLTAAGIGEFARTVLEEDA